MLKLRAGTYHTDFMVNGQRVRQTLETSDWREATQRERELVKEATEGILPAKGQDFARKPFREAADKYIEEITPRLRPLSVRSEKERARRLIDYFDKLPLIKISPDSIREFVTHRKGQGMSNRTVNMECGLLRRILKRAKLWRRIADDFKPLPQTDEIGRAMTPEEEARLTALARTRPEWRNARLAFELARNTAMRSAEIRNLRWSNINLIDQTLTIRRAGTKTNSSVRMLPLNHGAQQAILELRERSKGFAAGDVSPDWYIFPRRTGLTKRDPTKPLSGWRTAWRALRAAAAQGDKVKGIPAMPSLLKLRFHDLRHTVISELAEGQTSDQTIMSIAGHVSPRMLAHYSHIRMEAKRRALDSLPSKPLNPAPATQGYGTNHVTNRDSRGQAKM